MRCPLLIVGALSPLFQGCTDTTSVGASATPRPVCEIEHKVFTPGVEQYYGGGSIKNSDGTHINFYADASLNFPLSQCELDIRSRHYQLTAPLHNYDPERDFQEFLPQALTANEIDFISGAKEQFCQYEKKCDNYMYVITGLSGLDGQAALVASPKFIEENVLKIGEHYSVSDGDMNSYAYVINEDGNWEFEAIWY